MRGSIGERRPADPVQRAFMVAQIATGEREEKLPRNQRKGGPRRAAALTPDERSVIARKAAVARWKKSA